MFIVTDMAFFPMIILLKRNFLLPLPIPSTIDVVILYHSDVSVLWGIIYSGKSPFRDLLNNLFRESIIP